MAIDGGQLLHEHAAGVSFRQLGRRHGVSHERARQLVIAELDNLVFDSTIRVLSPDLDNPAFVIPNQAQGDRATALRVVDMVRHGVRAKGVKVKTVVRHVRPGAVDNHGVPSPGGTVFMLELDTRRDPAEED
jgi:hypothetical protein